MITKHAHNKTHIQLHTHKLPPIPQIILKLLQNLLKLHHHFIPQTLPNKYIDTTHRKLNKLTLYTKLTHNKHHLIIKHIDHHFHQKNTKIINKPNLNNKTPNQHFNKLKNTLQKHLHLNHQPLKQQTHNTHKPKTNKLIIKKNQSFYFKQKLKTQINFFHQNHIHIPQIHKIQPQTNTIYTLNIHLFQTKHILKNHHKINTFSHNTKSQQIPLITSNLLKKNPPSHNKHNNIIIYHHLHKPKHFLYLIEHKDTNTLKHPTT